MRVLFFGTIFPRPWNATKGIYCFQNCRAIEELGHEVRVVSPRSFLERSGPDRSIPGLRELEVEYPRYFYPPGILQHETDRFMALSSWRTMRRTMREFRPDAILSYWVHPDGAVAAHFARQAGIPSAVIVGGSDVLVLARDEGPRKQAVIRSLHMITAVVCVGRHLADAVVALGIPRSKVHVVYQGVDEKLFAPGSKAEARKKLGVRDDDTKVLVQVGNLVPVKGVDVLLDAVHDLVRRGRKVQLQLVGDGEGRATYEEQARRLGLGDAVRFVGKVSQHQLADWYRAADLTVLASRSEGVPNVLRESLACGTPFVATRVGGTDEIAEGTTCPLVPAEDAGALAEAIAAALDAPPRIGSERMLSWRESTQQILDLLCSR
jgi:glycosyltransferase involved in cell wall biosynthesis